MLPSRCQTPNKYAGSNPCHEDEDDAHIDIRGGGSHDIEFCLWYYYCDNVDGFW